MNALLDWDDVEVGEQLLALQIPIRRAELVMYAGASGDFNPIHWSDRAARSSGLPTVIAHGMLTMAIAGRLASDWAGDPASIKSFSARFSSPVPVPDDGVGTMLYAEGFVAEKLADNQVRLELRATIPGPDGEMVPVLKQAEAVVQL